MAHVDRFGRDHADRLLRFLRASGKYSFLVREADHVVTSSPALNGTAGRSTAVPSAPTSLFGRHRPLPAGQSLRQRWACDDRLDRDLQLGPDLDLLRGVLQKLAQQRRFRLKVIGNLDYAASRRRFEVIRWTAQREIEESRRSTSACILCPRTSGSAGRAGSRRSDMAMGLPCVATDVGTTPLHHPRRRKRAAGPDRRGMARCADALARRSGAAPPPGRGRPGATRSQNIRRKPSQRSIARSCRARWRVEREWKRASASIWPGPAGCWATHSTASSAACISSSAVTSASIQTGCRALDFRDFDAYRADVLGIPARLSLPSRRAHQPRILRAESGRRLCDQHARG